jgi:hypothetical protein
MAINSYEAGQVATCSGTFIDTKTGTAIVPESIHFELHLTTDGTLVHEWTLGMDDEVTVDEDDPTRFLARVDTTALSGEYTYRFFCPSGDGQGTKKGHFIVDNSIT